MVVWLLELPTVVFLINFSEGLLIGNLTLPLVELREYSDDLPFQFIRVRREFFFTSFVIFSVPVPGQDSEPLVSVVYITDGFLWYGYAV